MMVPGESDKMKAGRFALPAFYEGKLSILLIAYCDYNIEKRKVNILESIVDFCLSHHHNAPYTCHWVL
mgnify:CR=1 FL=1